MKLPNVAYSIASLALLAAVGCEQAPPPRFQLNMVSIVANDTSDPYQQEIADVLAGMFGTPDEPYAFPESGLNQQRLDLAAGAAYSDEAGVSHGLYRKHCVHCHGITGDGRGPTARFLNPYPRDYRQGLFKFKNTYNPAKPTDEDLLRVMMNGVPGTAMPSFSLLPNSEVEALIEYVKYLSIRGEMETRLVNFVYNDLGEQEKVDANGEPVLDEDGNPVMERIPLDPIKNPEQADIIKEELAAVIEPWQAAAENVVVPTDEEIPADDRTPEEIAESVAKGRELFYGTKANCFTCHGPTGLGDGQQTDFDNWNKELKAFVDATTQLAESIEERENAEEISEDEEVSLDRDREQLAQRQAVVQTFYPIRNAIPRNLRKGIYRGGRRRIDIFSRVHQGIAGTPMPGVGAASAGGQGTLTEAEIWNIVDYVLSLPYEALSSPQPALTLNEEPIAN
jgi:mono/diheme cytochrome c family protein